MTLVTRLRAPGILPARGHGGRGPARGGRAPSGVFSGTSGKDYRVLAAGTAQNIVGLAVFVVGTFAANILISRERSAATAPARSRSAS